MQHHRRAFYAALQSDFFRLLPETARARIEDLPSEIQQMIFFNAIGWVLTQGQLSLQNGRRVRALELVLGPGGARLRHDQRSYLKVLAACPFTLYEVQESPANHGVLLKNIFLPAWRPAWVGEQSGARSLADWDLVGARLIFTGERYQLCGGIYAFQSQEAWRVQKTVFDLLRDPKLEGAEWHSRTANDLMAEIVIRSWLYTLASS